jgi:hypothetical protein
MPPERAEQLRNAKCFEDLRPTEKEIVGELSLYMEMRQHIIDSPEEPAQLLIEISDEAFNHPEWIDDLEVNAVRLLLETLSMCSDPFCDIPRIIHRLGAAAAYMAADFEIKAVRTSEMPICDHAKS